jgi:hypothetical protein
MPSGDKTTDYSSSDYSSWKPVALLAIGSVTPLVLTLAPAEPVALGAGCLLAAALTKLTFNPAGPAPKSYDKAVEENAIKAVVMTSDTNRIVRLLLGSVYTYASITFAIRMAKPVDDVRLITRLVSFDPYAIGLLSLTWFACLVDFFFAGLWFSSGWCGQ